MDQQTIPTSQETTQTSTQQTDQSTSVATPNVTPTAAVSEQPSTTTTETSTSTIPTTPVTPTETANTATPVTPLTHSDPVSSTTTADPVTPATPTSTVTQPTHTPTAPTGDSKKKAVVITGVLVVVLFLIGSMLYISGVVTKTKRMGSYQNGTPTQTVQRQTNSQLSQEEREVDAVDTGNPESDITDIEKDLSTLE